MAAPLVQDPTKPVKPLAPPAAPAVAGSPAPAPSAPAAAPAPAPPAPTPPAPPAAPAPALAATPTTTPPAPAPATGLLGQTIQAPTADRLSLATQAFDTSAKASDPYYQKSLRDARSAAAGAGQLGSGQLRTSLGDLAHQRGLELDTLRAKTINDASVGGIADQYANVGIAQQQQGFQAGRSDASEAQRLAQQQLELAKSGQTANTALAEGALTGKYGGGDTLAAKQLGDASALAEKQFGLSSELGKGGLTLAQQQAADAKARDAAQLELAKTGQGQNYELASKGLGLQSELGKGQLELAKSGQAQAANQFSQSLAFQQATQGQNHELASAAQKLNEQVATGQLSIAQADQQLRQLQNSQQYGLAGQQLDLAKKAQDIGVDQFGKQFEAGQQQTAFNQAAMQAQIEEALKQGDFSRAQALLQAGSFGNPSDTALTLAQSYGTQAGNAGASAGGLLGTATANAQHGGGDMSAGQGAGDGIDWTSLLGNLPGLGGDAPPIQQTEGLPMAPDTTWNLPVVQPNKIPLPAQQLPLAGVA